MIEFIQGSKISECLECMIESAKEYLWLISPYIKLSGRIKDRLKLLKQRDSVAISIVYGKNEQEKFKSLSDLDFNFLKEFPNIKIYYSQNLHAKFYSNEDYGILCSMNLHQASQNENIEAGFKITRKDIISSVIASTLNSDPADDANTFFREVIYNSNLEFERTPEYKTNIFGLFPEYIGSKTGINITITPENSVDDIANTKRHKKQGFCIRTGAPIPFNMARPYCMEAYKSWSVYGNVNYPEKYCHLTGRPSNGKTSMKHPVMF